MTPNDSGAGRTPDADGRAPDADGTARAAAPDATADATAPVIAASGVSVKVRGRTLLGDVDVAFTPGIHGVIGRNGAGKTTLLRVLAGHVRPSSGAVAVVPLADATAHPIALSRVSADVRYAGATVGAHLDMASIGHPGLDRELALAILGDAGVGADTRTRTLSVGQRQLLSVACALASGAPVVLLDEPFTGLDAATRLGLRDRIIAVAAERPDLCLVLTSHRSEDLAGLVDDVTVVALDPVDSVGRATGPVVLDDARASHPTLRGPGDAVYAVAGDAPRIAEKSLGAVREVTLSRALTQSAHRRADATGVYVTHPTDGELIDILAIHGAPERN